MSTDNTRPDPAALRERFTDFKRRSDRLRQQISALEHVEADNRDGVLGVMVDAHGKLLALQISEEVQRALAPSELGNRIMELYRRANAAVEAKVMEQTAAVYGTGFTPGKLLRGEVDTETVTAATRDRLRG